MPRCTGALTGILVAVAMAAALSGCSSSSGDDRKPQEKATRPTVPAAPASASASGSQDARGVNGRLDYTGSLAGGFDVTTSVGCRILAGKLVAVTAPDADEEEGADGFAVPSFDATTGNVSVATLITPDGHTFVAVGAKGVSAEKQGGVWTLTVSGAKLAAEDASGGSVSVFGRLTCTKVHGTEAP